MAEAIGLVSEVSAALSIFDRITQEIRRLRVATTEVPVLEQVQVEIDQTTQCLELVKKNGSLQVAVFEPSIAKLEKLGERLKNALNELDGGTIRRQKFRQRLKLGSSNRKKIDKIMQDMRRVRLDLLVQLQLSLVGINHKIHGAVQVGADALKAMDEKLEPLDGSFPKLAKLLETRKDDNGMISISKKDIKELLDRQEFKLETDPEPGPSTPNRPNKTNNEAKGWILDDAGDNISIYSDSTIPTLHEWGGRYETEIATSLFGSLSPILNDAEGVRRVTNALPHYLKAFARKLGAERQQRIYRDAMRHVHKYRRAISSRFQESVDKQLQRQHRQSADTGEIIPYGEKVGDWLSGVSPDNVQEKVDNSAAIEDEDERTDENEDETIPLELGNYLTVVTTSAAYDWLLSKLRHELLCYVPGETSVHEMISSKVLSLPIFRRVSRNSGPPHCSVLYETDWDPLVFFKEQKYHEEDYQYSDAEAFSRVLTVTGILNEAEGLSCGEYICRTWPQSGKAFIQLMEMHLASKDVRENRVTLQDGTRLLVSLNFSRVSFKATGQPDTVVEIGEELAWVSCAMRSFDDSKFVSLRPSALVWVTGQTENSLKLVMQLRCSEQPLTDASQEDSSGGCWRQLFRTPVIVQGFPIQRRAQPQIGIEMDLATMGLLARGHRISTFNGHLIIRGYHTMLVAVKAVRDMVLWHVLTKEDGSDIEYHDPRVQQLNPQIDSMVSWSQLKNMKHVVGWCSHVKNNTGAVDASFDVIGSGLPAPGRDFALERVNVGFSKYIVANATLVGTRETPRRMDHPAMPLEERIKSVASQYVVLFDNEVKKGWLLDGASVMLHLLRASLVQDEELSHKLEHSHGELSVFDGERPLNPIQVLLKRANMTLGLYELAEEREVKIEKSSHGDGQAGDPPEFKDITTRNWYCVKNRLDELSDVLFEICSHYSDMSIHGVGYKMKSLVKERLEGFEYVDLVKRSPTVQTKYIELPKEGRGWVDFTRGLQAVTLFGNGFGEILEPLKPAIDKNTSSRAPPSTSDVCDYWREVPPDKEYLATTNSILRKISQDKGGTRFSEANNLPAKKIWQILPDVYLESPSEVFGLCDCESTCSSGGKATRPCNRVLAAVPAARGIPSLTRFPKTGAVIFGCREGKRVRKAASGDRNKVHAKTGPEDEAASSKSITAESGTTASSLDPSTVATTQSSTTPHSNPTRSSETAISEPASVGDSDLTIAGGEKGKGNVRGVKESRGEQTKKLSKRPRPEK